MTSKIPEERYILKQDLWKKIDRSQEMIAESAKDVWARVEQVRDELKSYYDQVLAFYRESKEKLSADNKGDFEHLKADILTMFSNGTSTLDKSNREFANLLEVKLNAKFENMETKLNGRIDQLFKTHQIEQDKIVMDVSRLEDNLTREISDLKDIIESNMNKFNIEFDRLRLTSDELQGLYDGAMDATERMAEKVTASNNKSMEQLRKDMSGFIDDKVKKLTDVNSGFMNNVISSIKFWSRKMMDEIAESVNNRVNDLIDKYNKINESNSILKNNTMDSINAISNESYERKKLENDFRSLISDMRSEIVGSSSKLNDNLRTAKENLMIGNKNEISELKSDLQKLIERDLTVFVKEKNDLLRKIDNVLKVSLDSFRAEFSDNVDKKIDYLKSNVELMSRDIIAFKKDIIGETSMVKKEMMEKFVLMNNQFEKTIEKFKQLSSILSK